VKATMIGISKGFFNMKITSTDAIDFTKHGTEIVEILFLMLEAEFNVDIERRKLAPLFTSGFSLGEASTNFAQLLQTTPDQFPVWKREQLAELLREPYFWLL
jgi:hypothetical protein